MKTTKYRVKGTWKTGNTFDGELCDTMKDARKHGKQLLESEAVAEVAIQIIVTTISTVATYKSAS